MSGFQDTVCVRLTDRLACDRTCSSGLQLISSIDWEYKELEGSITHNAIHQNVLLKNTKQTKRNYKPISVVVVVAFSSLVKIY